MEKVVFPKFIEVMKRLSVEVNDHEICKRLEALMHIGKEDLNLDSVKNLLKNPLEFDPREIPEPYTMYVKHFIYMVKRNEKGEGKKYIYDPTLLGDKGSSRG
ncbi:MAG: hypothetical protein H7A25_20335 [Leptospiraceae bacterium]|nr:hypothetical protein [Leptospiraceae bacterium]MCP5502255.1 hypothetical protein [Leptospiraceae bacterium]